jgi:epoxyqueuosine reductase
LSEYISGFSNEIEVKYYTDDGPVMEKIWAQKAGIGWQGKHSNIINNQYGSWIFLSEIITNIEFIEYSVPVEDLCGNCRICIDACPTNAIAADRVVDSNLCISYQTIENKSELPDHLNFHGWVYGCDICQEVCPFNKNDKITTEAGFLSKPVIDNKNEKELSDITEEEFKQIFKDSPIKRTKHTGWLRNLIKFSQDKNK